MVFPISELEIQGQLQALKRAVERLGRERVQNKLKAEHEALGGVGEGKLNIERRLKTRGRLTSLNDVDRLISDLQKLRAELRYAHAFELKLDIEE